MGIYKSEKQKDSELKEELKYLKNQIKIMYTKENVVNIIKAREIEQGIYGAKGLTTEEWFRQFEK